MKKPVMLIFLSGVFFFLLSLNFSVYSDEFRIVNGEETTMEKWKESFSGVIGMIISLPDGGLSSCTGTLIDPEVVLTAAHCVIDDSGKENFPSNISIKSGLWVGYTSLSLAAGKSISLHQNADIALLFLDKKIPDHAIYSVRKNPEENIGEEGVIVGYGVTGPDETDSGTQRWGETTILNIWSGSENILEIGNPSGSCYGDSGGPFFTQQNGKNVVSGVTSSGYGDCPPDEGSFYIHVLKYREWIEEQMKFKTGHDLEKICGDGDIDDGEICEAEDVKDCAELGNYVPGIDAKCNVDCDEYDISVCKDQICGDHRKQGIEACDDGNTENGDYCSSDCKETTGRCGDNIVQSNEECDDGNKETEDGCDHICNLECGNDWLESNEECDDGNRKSGDGCDEACTLECGNSILNIGEECDDGNHLPGDGCDDFCKKEPGDSSGCSAVIAG